MSLRDSQQSMRPLCSDLLFTPVDYIFVKCLTKCMSRIIGVQSISYSSNFIFTVISLLYYYSEGVIQFWEVNWALGLKKWLKSQGRWHITESKSP